MERENMASVDPTVMSLGTSVQTQEGVILVLLDLDPTLDLVKMKQIHSKQLYLRE